MDAKRAQRMISDEDRTALHLLRNCCYTVGSANDAEDHGYGWDAGRMREEACESIRNLMDQHPFGERVRVQQIRLAGPRYQSARRRRFSRYSEGSQAPERPETTALAVSWVRRVVFVPDGLRVSDERNGGRAVSYPSD